jgi:hypothetical protein
MTISNTNTLFLHNNGQDGALNMEFVRRNWRDSEALTQCFSEHCPFTGEYSRNWGEIPTNKIIVNTEGGFPRRIRTYSGMNWSARWGYGSPYLDLKIEDFSGHSPVKGVEDRI